MAPAGIVSGVVYSPENYSRIHNARLDCTAGSYDWDIYTDTNGFFNAHNNFASSMFVKPFNLDPELEANVQVKRDGAVALVGQIRNSNYIDGCCLLDTSFGSGVWAYDRLSGNWSVYKKGSDEIRVHNSKTHYAYVRYVNKLVVATGWSDSTAPANARSYTYQLKRGSGNTLVDA